MRKRAALCHHCRLKGEDGAVVTGSLGGAEGGTRTPTVLLPPAPQAGASANSATSAQRGKADLLAPPKPRRRREGPPLRSAVSAATGVTSPGSVQEPAWPAAAALPATRSASAVSGARRARRRPIPARADP